uniref:SGNH hydrolase-type esterase domain-containing protein n=1 Tax=Lactuca sativa TaxID=4236 RepID=A0A9R1VPL3_LACSA|nr:hypothetical protein LSAT_V11C400175730 [Lactuca sativa]
MENLLIKLCFQRELLNFDEYIPTYSTVTDQQISKGVNYASGAAGIRDETGSHLGGRISLDMQLHNHCTTVSRIFKLQQNKTFTNGYLHKCIYLVNIGSNDYINNYLQPTYYTTSHIYTTVKYAKVLVRQYSITTKGTCFYTFFRTLYDLGGRKIVVFGLGPIGCTPAEISNFGIDGESCVEAINDAVKQFNGNLRSLVDKLNLNNPDAKFIFINLTSIALQQPGLGLSNGPCCEVRADGQCIKNTHICPVRALSIYYDGFHPTEIANTIIATTSFYSVSPNDASPYDISHLIRQ